jgi:hypothetical protein
MTEQTLFPFRIGQVLLTPFDGHGEVVGGWRDVQLGWIVTLMMFDKDEPTKKTGEILNFVHWVLKPAEELS